ncbi:hypothetical protein MJO47_05180 [Desulfuromonas sp. KJ2020]|uniref:hypothetical protein n=1 Tax=Desulfuromonas sp. KJ2020 TaxID=2919173 RepID=UPI0020A74793|nr:hypothetical protein [Desulfuromonas sp. KJ2020]MCP3176488.1 hypothetical protein [Desulfuromonas sp. KJ2020]
MRLLHHRIPALLATVCLVSGCMSVRTVTSLKPGENTTSASLDGVKIHLVDATWQAQAQKIYPLIFSDDMTAIPVQPGISSKSHSPDNPLNYLLAFTLFAVPGYFTTTTDTDVSPSLVTKEGEQPLDPVTFRTKKAEWATLITPIALLPVPGPADVRSTGIGAATLYESSSELQQKATVEAIVQTLRQADQTQLQQAVRDRAARLQQNTLDGSPVWTFLGFEVPITPTEQDLKTARRQPAAATTANPATAGDSAQVAKLFIFPTRPTWKSTPQESIVVAKREGDGGWKPVTGYLRSARSLTSAKVLLENGEPARVILSPVSEPPVEDFIDTPELSGKGAAELLRWSNNMLLEAKNRSLPKTLREGNRDDLLELVTRIERAALELNEQSERAKDRAQAMVEKGEGDPAPDRELAILCRQRLDVLRPILGALQQEIALRR